MTTPRLFVAIATAVHLIISPLGAQVAGSLDPAFDPNVDGTDIFATAVQPDGKILIGGSFFYVGDEPRMNIARLNADGSVESTATFNPGLGANGAVTCIAVQADGKILIGGLFNFVNGQPRGQIARLNTDGSVESTATFNPGAGVGGGGVGGGVGVDCIAVQADGKILIGGYFNFLNGQPRGGIARLNPNGTVESAATFNPGIGANGRVRSIAVQPDGKILLGGGFSHVDNHTRASIARLNADGTVEDTTTFNPGVGVGGLVKCIVLQADRKILLGDFGILNDPRAHVARLNPNGTLDTTFNPSFLGQFDSFDLSSIALQANGKILIGGDHHSLSGPSESNIFRLNANGTLESSVTFDPGTGPNDPVQSTTLQGDGKILIGGRFNLVNGQPRNHFARLRNIAATQNLTVPSGTRLRWSRGGSAPEIQHVTFELSIDDGASWTPLGAGVRISGGWECTGLSLPVRGSIRARGRPVGSGGLVEELVTFGPQLLSLSVPKAGQKVTGSTVVFSGVVSDLTRVARIELALNGGTAQMATLDSGTGDWTLSLLPENGVNTVVVTAFDANGLVSAQITRTFTFQNLRPEIAGFYNGLLEATANSQSPIDHEGLVAITVRPTGTFTGKVTLSGMTFPVTGIVLNDGSARFGKGLAETLHLIKPTKPANVSLGHFSFTLDTIPGADRITGLLAHGDATVATFDGARALYTAKKNPVAPFKNVPTTLSDPLGNKGRYTALFRALSAPNNGQAANEFPQGHGWAKITIAPTGRVTIIGKLADGSTVSYGNSLSKTNELPFFAPLYAKKGFAAGRVTFDPAQPQSDATGLAMKWFKPANAGDKLYPDGWPDGIAMDFAASKLVLPTKASVANPSPQYVFGTHNIFGLSATPLPTNVKFLITDGGTPGFSNDATVDARSKMIIGAASEGESAAPKLKASIVAGNGAFAGSFTHPGNNKATLLSGVVFQKTHSAAGFFLYLPPKPSTGQSGAVSILPEL